MGQAIKHEQKQSSREGGKRYKHKTTQQGPERAPADSRPSRSQEVVEN